MPEEKSSGVQGTHVPTFLAHIVYPAISLIIGGLLGSILTLIFQYQLVYKPQIEEARQQTAAAQAQVQTGLSQTKIMQDQLEESRKGNAQKDAEIAMQKQREEEIKARNEELERKLRNAKQQWEIARSVFTSTITNAVNSRNQNDASIVESAQTVVNERDSARTRMESVRDYLDAASRHLNSTIDKIRIAIASKDTKRVKELMSQFKSEWDEKKLWLMT